MKRLRQLKKIFIVFIFAFILQPQESQAACGLSLTVSNLSVTWTLNYAHIAVSFVVNKSGVPGCSYGVGFSKGGGTSYTTRRALSGSDELFYQLYGDTGLTNILKDVPDITASTDVITGSFTGGANKTQTKVYYFDIPYATATSPIIVKNGTYTDTFTMSVYEGANPLTFVTPVNTYNVTLTVTVNPLISVSLVDQGGAFSTGATTKSINFGTLVEGNASSVDLRVRTNAGFSITFSSLNNGNLKHTNPAKSGSLVPYSFYVNGVLLNMSTSASTPVTGLSGSGQTELNGLGYPIRAIIGSITGGAVLSGTHQDTITITAVTTE